MLKMALFDWASNEKCCSVDGGRGICPLFSSPPRGVWQLKSPHPRELAIQGKKKMLMPGVSPGGGGAGRRWNWLMHYISVICFPSRAKQAKKQKKKNNNAWSQVSINWAELSK